MKRKDGEKDSPAQDEDSPSIVLGAASKGKVAKIPLGYLTRHGLIAGTTGTGKSRAMQVVAEQLADKGANVFVSDVKGDASGFCVQGKESPRNELAPYAPHPISANYWSAGNRLTPLRFSVSGIGPVLLSRLLSLNPTQESHLALAFSYARKDAKPLHTLDDLMDTLDEMLKTGQRGMSKSSVAVIERKILPLAESGVSELFGEPSIELEDLKGLNVLNLSDARTNMSVSIAPAFLLQLLFNSLPEKGEVEIPEYSIFFDEAHYLFKDANKSLKDLMVTILKQIRSKGVSVFFVTQDVSDLPEEVLSQLSTKIIFSQKAFTQKGNRRLKSLAKSFPDSRMDLMEKLKGMPPGTALLSTLDQEGNQTPPEEVKIFAPATTMEVAPDETLLGSTNPRLPKKYAQRKQPSPAKAPAPGEKTGTLPLAKPRTANAPIVQKSKFLFSKNPNQGRRTPAKKAPPKKKKGRGKPIWSAIFSFLIGLLRFTLKALAIIFKAIIFNPLKSFFRYLVRKPIRILWLIVLLIILYVFFVNWELIESLLKMLDFS
jgi:hypothetical protein